MINFQAGGSTWKGEGGDRWKRLSHGRGAGGVVVVVVVETAPHGREVRGIRGWEAGREKWKRLPIRGEPGSPWKGAWGVDEDGFLW